MQNFNVRLSPGEAAVRINDHVINSAISTECVGRYSSVSPDGRETIIMVFEKYFMRNSSRASLSVMIENLKGSTTVTSIGSGGSQSTLFSFDWGAGDSFADLPRDALNGYIV